MSFYKKLLIAAALASVLFGPVLAVAPAQAYDLNGGAVLLAGVADNQEEAQEEQQSSEDDATEARQAERADFQEELEQKFGRSAEEAGIEAGIFAGVSQACFELGFCSLCDVLVILITIADWILRVFAVLAVVFFVYGAGYLMLSSGNEQMVSKGKGIIRATIVGSIIVLLAWQLMNVVITLLANQSIFEEADQTELAPFSWHDVAGRCAAGGGTATQPPASPGGSGGGS